MAVRKEDVRVRWHPQYKPSAKRVIITGYRVYAYVGHPLLGVVRGSESIVKTEKEAKKLASEMRKRFR